MTFSLDLDFVKPGKGDRPFKPYAQVYVKSHTKDDSRGLILVTPDCVTMQELDCEIDRLRKELESIRKKGKRRFETSPK